MSLESANSENECPEGFSLINSESSAVCYKVISRDFGFTTVQVYSQGKFYDFSFPGDSEDLEAAILEELKKANEG